MSSEVGISFIYQKQKKAKYFMANRDIWVFYHQLRRYCTSYPKKLQNYHVLCSISKSSTSFWKIIYASYSKLSKELKNSIKIKVGQAVLELLIQKQHLTVWSITWKPLGLLKCQCHFWVPWTVFVRCMCYFSKRCWLFWDRAKNMKIFGRRCSSPLMKPLVCFCFW